MYTFTLPKPINWIIFEYFGNVQISGSLYDKHVSEVPKEVRELHIATGYRPIDSGFKKSFRSLWRSHNETFNVWTHLLGLLYFIYFFCDEKFREKLNHIPSDQCLPMYVYLAGVCLLFTCSSGAHLLNCVSMTWRNVCFMVDYSAISIYGGFTAIVYYYYNWNSRIPKVIKDLGGLFIPIVLISAVLATWASSRTRLHQSKLCHVIRTSSFALPFLVGSLPPIIRVCEHIYNELLPGLIITDSYNMAESSKNSSTIITTTGLSETEFCYYYLKQMFFLGAACIVNMIKVPECIYPGNFDIIGHSHQWFHILIFLGVREQFWLIINDISQYGRINLTASSTPNGEAVVPKEPPFPTLYLALVYTVLISSLAVIIAWYGYSIHLIHSKKKSDIKNGCKKL